MRIFAERRGKGFTLIELLIVVAIIAILAAIAVPNFIEAQSRAKISRAKADMRSLATAVEAYAVDNNQYPVLHNPDNDPPPVSKWSWYMFVDDPNAHFVGVPWLSTPVAYISDYPQQAFSVRKSQNQGRHGYQNFSYFLINFKGAAQDPPFLEQYELELGSAARQLQSPMPINVIGGGYAGIRGYSDWILFGVGPSGIMDLHDPTIDPNSYGVGTASIFMTFTRNSGQAGGTYLEGWRTGWWRAYDPTNGTLSLGFIFRTQSGTPGE